MCMCVFLCFHCPVKFSSFCFLVSHVRHSILLFLLLFCFSLYPYFVPLLHIQSFRVLVLSSLFSLSLSACSSVCHLVFPSANSCVCHSVLLSVQSTVCFSVHPSVRFIVRFSILSSAQFSDRHSILCLLFYPSDCLSFCPSICLFLCSPYGPFIHFGKISQGHLTKYHVDILTNMKSGVSTTGRFAAHIHQG